MSRFRDPDDFWECETCAAKPGSPTLCESCLHNRRMIGQLQRKVDMLRAKLEIIKSTIELET